MTQSGDRFIRCVCATDALVEADVTAEKKHWNTYEMPELLRLAALGTIVSDRASAMCDASLDTIAHLVEEGVASADDSFSTAVATGFLDSVMHRWDEAASVQRLVDRLGPESSAYCNAYNRLMGIDRPLNMPLEVWKKRPRGVP